MDNSLMNPGVGGDSIRAKDRGEAKTQVTGRDLNLGGDVEILESLPMTGVNSKVPATTTPSSTLLALNLGRRGATV